MEILDSVGVGPAQSRSVLGRAISALMPSSGIRGRRAFESLAFFRDVIGMEAGNVFV
jgi:hypothetical protein